MRINLLVTSLALLSTIILRGQSLTLKQYPTEIESSFRSLSVVNDDVAWVGGSKGTIGKTIDGGKHWTFQTVEGFEQVDFRSLYAFNDQKAIIANAGAPAHILLTNDGGNTWKTVYTNTHEAAFFDGIDFWNEKDGIIYGDPIDGRMLLLKTEDGGISWKPVDNAPQLHEGEASFAASGTGIRCIGKNKVLISTGGIKSRLWISSDKGISWNSIDTPIVQGKNTTGIYSFAFQNNIVLLVGGDYTDDTMSTDHNFYSTDDGNTWHSPSPATRGYREGVEFISKNQVLAVGPSGIDVSHDKGLSWKPLSEEKGFHVVRKARSGTLVIAAGGKGQIATIDIP